MDCWDCRKAPATRTFLHLTKGHFPLCDECFCLADHDEDYLDYCDDLCMRPPLLPDAVTCRCCTRLVRRCSCRHPWRSTRDGYDWCVDCKGSLDRFFEHKARADRFHDELIARALHRARFNLIHEELMAKAWHPTRVSRWLEHGWEVLDMMMGVD